MGSPILLGGAHCQISPGALESVHHRIGVLGRKPDPGAYTVLTEVSVELRQHGYEPTEPRRGKADDVRIRCVRGDRYIEVIVVAEPHSGAALDFGIEAWGYTKIHNNEAYRELAEDWERLASVVEVGLRNRFAAEPVTRLSAKEVDARYSAKEKD